MNGEWVNLAWNGRLGAQAAGEPEGPILPKPSTGRDKATLIICIQLHLH